MALLHEKYPTPGFDKDNVTMHAYFTEVSTILSGRLGVKTPKISPTRCNRRGGWYSWHGKAKGTIRIGQTAWMGTVPTFLHEYAHHLSYERTSGVVKKDPHGLAFRYALLELTSIFYGNTDQYPWEKEYPLVKRWYAKLTASEKLSF